LSCELAVAANLVGYLEHEGFVEVISELTSDNRILVSDIVERLEEALQAFDQAYIPEAFDPFAEVEWPSDAKEEEKFWKPLTEKLQSGPRNAGEIDEIKRSIAGENRAANQKMVVQKFDRLERRLVTLHAALIEALGNSDSLDGALKTRATMTVLRMYLRFYQVGMILSPALVTKRYFFWHGLLFLNAMSMDNVEEDRKVSLIMTGISRAVMDKAADKIGSRKLGEVFKVLARNKDVGGFIAQLNFACLLRAKPKDWLKAAMGVVANTGAREYYLRVMLVAAFEQFNNEVNTGNDREQLKSLIAAIQIKRKLKKDHPGSDTLAKVVTRLEKQDYFGRVQASTEPNIDGRNVLDVKEDGL